jgi:hypothetical protein
LLARSPRSPSVARSAPRQARDERFKVIQTERCRHGGWPRDERIALREAPVAPLESVSEQNRPIAETKGFASAAVITWEIARRGYRQHMTIMNWVRPITGLYWGLVAVYFYVHRGRQMPHRSAREQGIDMEQMRGGHLGGDQGRDRVDRLLPARAFRLHGRATANESARPSWSPRQRTNGTTQSVQGTGGLGRAGATPFALSQPTT